MKDQIGRWSFLRMALGIGVVYEFAPLMANHIEAGAITDFLKRGWRSARELHLRPVQRPACRLSRPARPTWHQSV